MKSRSALTIATIVLLAFSLTSECQQNTTQAAPHVRRRHPGVLNIIIHGATVTVPGKEETIVVVPQASDANHLLLTSPYPSTEDARVLGSCDKGAYLFTVSGAKMGAKRQEDPEAVLIDPNFSPIVFKVASWQLMGNQKDYFVLIRLPAPRAIRALGPLYEVQFGGSSRLAHVPLTEILEFPVRDMDDVRLVRSCGKERNIERPLSCQEMRRRYKDYFRQHPMADSPDSQRPYMNYELQHCPENASYLFVGIGLDPQLSHEQIEAHGREFFNHKILPEIYGGEKNVPPEKRIVEKGYGPRNGEGGARLIRASFSGEQPLYVPVAMTENCTSPGGIVLR